METPGVTDEVMVRTIAAGLFGYKGMGPQVPNALGYAGEWFKLDDRPGSFDSRIIPWNPLESEQDCALVLDALAALHSPLPLWLACDPNTAAGQRGWRCSCNGMVGGDLHSDRMPDTTAASRRRAVCLCAFFVVSKAAAAAVTAASE